MTRTRKIITAAALALASAAPLAVATAQPSSAYVFPVGARPPTWYRYNNDCTLWNGARILRCYGPGFTQGTYTAPWGSYFWIGTYQGRFGVWLIWP